ncbi:MAG: hypothetical protein KDK11_19630 [Maritimibacter sp.]|nr:hypothetical protein [Maritimibacter sp.]
MIESTAETPTQMLGPRSRLLSAFFDHLNAQGIVYAVMNNHGDLPQVIPSDVDFTVPMELFARLDRFVITFAKTHGAFVVQKLWHGNRKCAYILAVGPAGAREFIQLDFFVAFSTKGAPALLSHEELVAGSQTVRNFKVPHPSVEYLFVALRRLFKNDWSDRHCARIAELRQQIGTEPALPPRFAWLGETLNAAAAGDLATVQARRAADWAQLRRSARQNMRPDERRANAWLQTRRIAHRLRDETGFLAVVLGSMDPVRDSAMDVMEMVFHRHLRLDANALASLGPVAAAKLPAELALLKRRKGLVFLQVQPGHSFGRTLARRLDRLGLVDLQLAVDPAVEKTGHRAPVVEVTTASDIMEAIVTRQAEKTTRAIARGGTQTSG